MPGFEVIDGKEFDEVKQVFDSGGVLFRHGFDHLRNNCFKTRDFEAEFAKKMGVTGALAVSSGTAALRVAIAAAGLGPGDEIIIPAFTFVATAEAIIESGATPVCVDIDETLNLSPSALELAVSTRTKAVIVVHMLGTPARLGAIQDICKKNDLLLIEDTAWGCGGSLEGRPLGTWGDIGAFSFDYAKTMTTGEGGMVVSGSKAIIDKAAAWHDHGHENNPAVPRWRDTRSSSGFNFRLTELQAAVGLAQLKKLDDIVTAQRHSANLIWSHIEDIRGVARREAPVNSFETCDALVIMMPSALIAERARVALVEAGLGTKILPEALTWHFAKHWEHMPTLRAIGARGMKRAFLESEAILTRAVALPISVKEPTLEVLARTRTAIRGALDD